MRTYNGKQTGLGMSGRWCGAWVGALLSVLWVGSAAGEFRPARDADPPGPAESAATQPVRERTIVLHDFERAGDFGEAMAAYRESGNKAELLAAAAVLKQAGTWKDPRARGPWETASAVVVGAARALPENAGDRRALLDLAADLLDAPTMRLRGIQPERIIEGLLSARVE